MNIFKAIPKDAVEREYMLWRLNKLNKSTMWSYYFSLLVYTLYGISTYFMPIGTFNNPIISAKLQFMLITITFVCLICIYLYNSYRIQIKIKKIKEMKF